MTWVLVPPEFTERTLKMYLLLGAPENRRELPVTSTRVVKSPSLRFSRTLVVSAPLALVHARSTSSPDWRVRVKFVGSGAVAAAIVPSAVVAPEEVPEEFTEMSR